jgi:long-chain acyl-CoA synthetase
VEAALRASPYIADAMVFGDRRPFLVALLAVDDEELRSFASSLGLPTDDWTALLRDPRIQQLLDAEVERCNRRLARYEWVKRYRVLQRSLTIEGGELTPTLKIRRDAIAARHQPLIDGMYAELPPA